MAENRKKLQVKEPDEFRVTEEIMNTNILRMWKFAKKEDAEERLNFLKWYYADHGTVINTSYGFFCNYKREKRKFTARVSLTEC